MARWRARLRPVLARLGLADESELPAGTRRRTDLVWAVLGPTLVVLGAWALGGSFFGGLVLLVMVPFVVVGVRTVLARPDANRPAKQP